MAKLTALAVWLATTASVEAFSTISSPLQHASITIAKPSRANTNWSVTWGNPFALRYAGDDDDGGAAPVDVPPCVVSPVLRQVYPAMVSNVEKYGHPNIPLGSKAGRQCKTLRRLQFQGKLSPDEAELLEGMGFRFNSFEDVYEEADFDDCLSRLLEYEEENRTGFQIPKKYPEDPELGAWVTMLRRIGWDDIDPDRRKRLDDVGFAWVSTRKCGSSFMKTYRPLLERLQVDGETAEEVVSDQDVRKWLKAQRDAFEKGNLSESRVGYLDALPGVDWRAFE